MNVSEMINKVVAKNNETELFDVLGVRFEKKNRVVGEECGNSKSNIDRLDIRDFPEFGTDEYESMDSCNGTCAYDINYWENHIDLDDLGSDYHVYVVGGNSYEEGEDYDEMVINNAVVVSVIL